MQHELAMKAVWSIMSYCPLDVSHISHIHPFDSAYAHSLFRASPIDPSNAYLSITATPEPKTLVRTNETSPPQPHT